MKTFLLSLCLCSCVPKAIIVEPVAPHAARAKVEVKAAADSAKKIQSSVTVVHTQAKDLLTEVNTATKEVERLKANSINPTDFDALWLMMTDLKTNAWAHEIKVSETVTQTIEQSHLQDTAVKTTEALEVTAIEHDKGVVKVTTQLAKAEKASAVNGVYKKWVILAVVILLIWGILQVYKPPFLR